MCHNSINSNATATRAWSLEWWRKQLTNSSYTVVVSVEYGLQNFSYLKLDIDIIANSFANINVRKPRPVSLKPASFSEPPVSVSCLCNTTQSHVPFFHETPISRDFQFNSRYISYLHVYKRPWSTTGGRLSGSRSGYLASSFSSFSR